jgi:sugar (pentulose or hexulose) kinase
MIDVALGIDVGTSGVRIAARGRDGVLHSLSEALMNLPLQAGIRILQDPQIWWQGIEKAFAGLKLDGLNVRALAIDGTSGTIVPIDETGHLLGLASMYNDLAEAEDVARVVAAAPKETAALGGSSPLARAISMKSRILHQADWLMGQFSGRFDVTDENNALKSGYDPVARNWPDWIAATGFDVKLFPHVVPVGTKIGEITAARAKQFGLPSDVAIVTGTTDGCAAFLASGAKDDGDGVTSLGTTLTLKLLSATPVFAPLYGIYSHRIGERWLAGGASNSGGKVLAQTFKKEDMERLTALVDPERPTGLDFYPLPAAGERFPISDPNYEPRITPRPSDDAVYFQALLEGIAGIEALGYQRLSELGASPLKTIRSAGGGAANDKWTAIRLKKLGVPQLPSASEHAAMGTARLAWWGVGHED